MNKEKRRVPKLRFPGFTEDWEQRKLGDYLSIPEKEILEVASSDDLITVKLNLGGVELGASRETLSLGSTVYYKRYAGQFIYGKQNFFNGSMGLIPTNLDGKGSSGDVPSFNVSNIEENYLYTYVSRESYWRSKEAAASGTGSKRIHEKTFLDFNIDVPSVDEQKLISNTFDLIDRFITLHQRKLEHLNLKKKGLLQKLFPKNGERYPELRFPGFTDAWEQRKLGDIVDFLDGQRKPLKESERTKGKYPYYGASGIIDYINDYLFDENLVLLSEDGANIIDRNYPVCFIATGQYWVNNHAHVLKVKTGVIDKFICESLERLDYTKFNTGTAQPKLNQDICQKIVITIPNEDEQKYISEFLDRINNIITLHQRKLEHLQLQKKALLQQMFV